MYMYYISCYIYTYISHKFHVSGIVRKLINNYCFYDEYISCQLLYTTDSS